MFLKIYNLFISAIFILSISGCQSENLVNDPNVSVPTSTLTADLSSITILESSSITFEVTALKADETEDGFNAVSSNTDVVSLTVSGKSVYVNAVSVGTSNIIISSDSGNTLVVSVNITKTAIPTLTLDKDSVTLIVESSSIIIATATTDGSTSDTISAISSDTNVSTVEVIDNNITVTAVSEGNATITVTSGSGLQLTSEINVTIAGSASLTIDNTLLYINEGSSDTVMVTATTDGVSTDTFTAISSNTSIATVNVVENNITVTGLNSGSTTIVVTSGSGIITTCSIVVNSVNNSLVINGDYVKGTISDDNGIVYPFDAEYGKLYEIWVSDAYSQEEPLYTLDVVTSVYNEDKTKEYLAFEDQLYTAPRFVNPIESGRLFIHVKPMTLGTTGSYAIKIVETTTLSEGMRNVPLPLEDSVIHQSKVGKVLSKDNWSYYTTAGIKNVTKTIYVSNITPAEDLFVYIYEDTTCTTPVTSTNSNVSGFVSLSHTYTKNGTFCVAVNNKDLLNSTTYDIQTSGNKADSSKTYVASAQYQIPDNSEAGVTSSLSVSYGSVSINKLSVEVNIVHTSDSDLSFTLTSPLGTEIILSQNNGLSGDNYTGTVFDDNTSISISDVNATAPFNGTYLPEEPLSGFNLEAADGIWSLKIIDNSLGDVGFLSSWSITVD